MIENNYLKLTFTEHIPEKPQEKQEEMFYIVSVRGLKPAYYPENQKDAALDLFKYCYRFFSGVSIEHVKFKRIKKDLYVTGRTL